jgi:hypothetical protein
VHRLRDGLIIFLLAVLVLHLAWSAIAPLLIFGVVLLAIVLVITFFR